MATELDHIHIRGARQHNLKGVDVKIPKKKLVVLTGVSGSGKSSLAFDTLYAEGQRRYVESLSAYARQFLDRLDKPRYDSIRGLSPAISIEQKTGGSSPRSTVGTITEIADYLRVLFARVGKQHCPTCSKPVSGQSAEQIAMGLWARRDKLPATVLVLARVLENRKGEHRELLEQSRRDGYSRLRVDGDIVRATEIEALDKKKKHTVDVVIDRIRLSPANRGRLNDSIEAALKVGGGTLRVAADPGGRAKFEEVFSEKLACTKCALSFPELTPQSFSFNAPQGMCASCNGLGTNIAVSPDLLIPNPNLSLDEGALALWGPDIAKKQGWSYGFRVQILKQLKIDILKPYKKFTKKQRDLLLYGTGDKRYKVKWKGKTGGEGTFGMRWEGVAKRLFRKFQTSSSERNKQRLAKYIGHTFCQECSGGRLRTESQSVLIGKRSLVDVSRMTVAEAEAYFGGLALKGAAHEIAKEILKEIAGRLGFLTSVGLGYLSLDRTGPSLSGGESQRIRLASQVGADLTGVIYILDEPSIGLHQRDNARLLKTLIQMRDIGNTVVVVEHDEDTITAADHVIDFGPGAGIHGGSVVHQGTPASLKKNPKSLTGQYLSGKKRIEVPELRRPTKRWLTVEGARENNLKELTVKFPLGVLTVVTGVSGAGKSSLVNGILAPALSRELHRSTAKVGLHRAIKGINALDKVIIIDQKPIGRTPRSNPATYIKVFDAIRGVFAQLPEARSRGYKPGRFSFNVKGGRCEACQGDGVQRVEMHFLSDVYVKCDECEGKRFNAATLEIAYRGNSITDILNLTVAEALDLFSAHPKIANQLRVLKSVGVDYLHLGQPSPTLSGGEAQRIKLARELSRRGTGRTLYILDEPTTGLHFDDIRKLMAVLQELVEMGNTVVVIEHNLDVIKTADHLIDLGPEGGPGGGHVLAEGTPEEVAKVRASHTGRYLKPLLQKTAKASKAAKVAKKAPRSRKAKGRPSR